VDLLLLAGELGISSKESANFLLLGVVYGVLKARRIVNQIFLVDLDRLDFLLLFLWVG